MKPDDAIESITRFFNDLIGAIVPATVLVIGLGVMHAGPVVATGLKAFDGAILFLCLLGALFALGHVLLAIFEQALIRIFSAIGFISSFDADEAKKRASYRLFRQLVQNTEQGVGGNEEDWSLNDLRSVALTVSPIGESLGRRFMFLSLLCNGTGTALFIIAADFMLCRFFAPELLYSYAVAPHWFTQVVLLLLASVFLFRRAGSFHERAMTTPFAVAIAELTFRRNSNG